MLRVKKEFSLPNQLEKLMMSNDIMERISGESESREFHWCAVGSDEDTGDHLEKGVCCSIDGGCYLLFTIRDSISRSQ